MAFMGMFIAGVFLLIIAIVAGITFLLLVTATILLITKHKKVAKVLYIIAMVPIISGIILVAKFAYSSTHKEYETYSGETVIIEKS